MRVLVHFIQSNIRYNKIELGISYLISLIAVILFFIFANTPEKREQSYDIFLSVSFYGVLYVFFSNKKKTNIKYLLSLPISKAQMLFSKVTSDIVFFLPSIFLSMIALYYANLKLNMFFVFINLCVMSMIVSLFTMVQEIELPRLESTHASFVNRLIYVRKMMDVFFSAVMISIAAVVIYSLSLDVLIKQLLLFGISSVFFFYKFYSVLHFIKDESESYLILKRDIKRVGFKLAIVIIPLIISFYQSQFGKSFNDPLYKSIKSSDYGQIETLLDSNFKIQSSHLSLSISLDDSRSLAMLLNKKVKNDKLREEVFKKAIQLNKKEVFHLLLADYPKDFKFKSGFQPIKASVTSCYPRLIRDSIEKFGNINQVDDMRMTALHHAVKSNCYIGAVLLLKSGANPDLKDKSGKYAIDYTPSHQLQDYLSWHMKDKYKPKSKAKRSVATEMLIQQLDI